MTQFSCPIALERYPRITLAHGGGGKLMHQLISELFQAAFSDASHPANHDSALLFTDSRQDFSPPLAFTTDSFVVSPLFFPGGSIGELAVYGTVNDLAVAGAKPCYLSAAFILEEGLEMETLWKVAVAMGKAAQEAGVSIVTGDTKVVERGKADQLFINTSGVGTLLFPHAAPHPERIQPGDVIIVSGDVGRHGVAVLASREGLSLETEILSDAAPLHHQIQALAKHSITPHCLRDATRGGVATTLIELSQSSRMLFEIEEEAVPVHPQVHAVAELLGLDPLYIANEGRMVLICSPGDAEKALELLAQHKGLEQTSPAAIIGQVKAPAKSQGGSVSLRTALGTSRRLLMLSGEQLPRIC